MITASTDELHAYLADLIETVERYGATVLPPNDAYEVYLGRDGTDLVVDLATRLPTGPRSRPVDLVLRERWRPIETGRMALAEYGYELRDHQLDYRRALHRHDADHFVRSFDVAVHEHCEATMGHETCAHYAGEPVAGAIDGFFRLYREWLAGARPDCSALRCLG